jgi:voltage-gated sodium channel
MAPMDLSLRNIIESRHFRNFILGMILLSGVIVGMETYPDFYREHHTLLHLIDRIILYIFAVEITLKIIAQGSRPWNFFLDPWNVFDFIIVAVCFIPGIDSHYVAVLRLARVLRVFRVISVFPKLRLLVNALLKSIPSMGYVVLLLALIFYIYAVMGTFLFGEKDPVHFGNLHMSMITLFKVLTLEGWTDIMNVQLYGTNDPMAEYNNSPVSYASVIYFVSFILLGAMIVMNLFIGVIMNSMQESHLEQEKEQRAKSLKSESLEGLMMELDRKVDDLKKDISVLNDTIKK